MSFNKYVIAIGVALSFLMASLNAEECPANANPINSDCQSMWKLYEALDSAEQNNESNPVVKVGMGLFQDEICELTKDRGQGRTAYANPKKLTADQCADESASCVLNTNGKPTVSLAKKDLCISEISQAALLKKYAAYVNPKESAADAALPTDAICKKAQGTCIGEGYKQENPDCNGGDIETPCEAAGCKYGKGRLPDLACFPPCRDFGSKAGCVKRKSCKWEDDACTFNLP